MFKQSRFFFSATMIAILFVSTLILSKNIFAKSRCPIQPPKTLLSLYLDSDMVVIADIKSESITKTEEGDENGYYADLARNLDVIKHYKGQKLPEISFTKSEYIPTVKTGETAEGDTQVVYAGGDFDGFYPNKLTVGKRYLFFLSKDEESGNFYQIDYRSSAREITSDNSDIYGKRLNELGKIIASKKNQMPNLAEWLVRLTEDEETRWDGASALSRSFGSLKYEQENEEGEEVQEVKTITDENFGEYSTAIAKQVTDEQKERLSSIFIDSLNQSLIGGEKEAEYDSALAELVGNWESARFAMYGFGILQATDKSDTEKIRRVMNFIADMVDDDQLSSSFYDYAEMIREKDVEVAAEPTENSEVISETAAEPNEIPVNLENVEQSAEVISEQIEPAQMENVEPKAEELTQEQIREQIFQKFVNRYQELLARNFAPEPAPEIEADIAQTIEESNK